MYVKVVQKYFCRQYVVCENRKNKRQIVAHKNSFKKQKNIS